jgi:inositol oxygenase
MKRKASKLESISDEVDLVNQLKVAAKEQLAFDEASKFDAEKDKAGFRRYEEACDRVKNFYAVGLDTDHFPEYSYSLTCHVGTTQKADTSLECRDPRRILQNSSCSDVRLGSYGDAQHPSGRVRSRHLCWADRTSTTDCRSDPKRRQARLDAACRVDSCKPARLMRFVTDGYAQDLGKLYCFFGAQGQWDVVGDTFVVGAKFTDKIIYPETFKENPDYYDEKLQTENGIYEPGCGLENVLLR